MPIFEFLCQSCGFAFERILRSPASEERCPRCGEVGRLRVSAPAASGSGCAPRGGFS